MKNVLLALITLFSFNTFAATYEILEAESVTTNVSRIVRDGRMIVDFTWEGKTTDSVQLVCAPGEATVINYRLNKPESISRVGKDQDSLVLIVSESAYLPTYLKGQSGGEKGDRWIVLGDLSQNPEKFAKVLATSVYDEQGANIIMTFATVQYVGSSDFKITGMSPVINYSSFTDVYQRLKTLGSELKECNRNAGNVVINNLF